MRTILVWAALALLLAPVAAFGPAAPSHIARSRVARSELALDAQQDDPLANPFLKAINAFQEAVQGQSIAATAKKSLAKLQAGDYDVAKTRAQLTSLIEDNPVVMLSFTT